MISLHENVISLHTQNVTKSPLGCKELRRRPRFVHFVHEERVSFTPVCHNHERNEMTEGNGIRDEWRASCIWPAGPDRY
jgi:hypothetical protein